MPVFRPQKKKTTSILTILASVPLWQLLRSIRLTAGVSKLGIKLLAMQAQLQNIPPNSVLEKQGDSPSLIYIIKRGFVRVVRKMMPEVCMCVLCSNPVCCCAPTVAIIHHLCTTTTTVVVATAPLMVFMHLKVKARVRHSIVALDERKIIPALAASLFSIKNVV